MDTPTLTGVVLAVRKGQGEYEAWCGDHGLVGTALTRRGTLGILQDHETFEDHERNVL